MRNWLRIGCCLVGLAGCKKEGGGEVGPAHALPAAKSDELWKLAPAGTQAGLVAVDGSLALVHQALRVGLAALKQAPGDLPLAELEHALHQKGIDLGDPASLAAAGIDLGRGAAIFGGPEVKLAVLPVADRAKFVAALGGKPETVDGATVDRLDDDLVCADRLGHYLCSDSAAGLAKAGKGDLAAKVATWPAELRGHLEVYVAEELVGAGIPAKAGQGLRAAIAFERGGLTLRVDRLGTIEGPAAILRVGAGKLSSGLGDLGPAGFGYVRAAGLHDLLQGKLGEIPDQSGPGGLNPRKLLGSLTGEVIGYALAGAPPRGFLKLGLSDETEARTMVHQCEALGQLAHVSASLVGEHCKLSLPASLTQAPVDLEGEIWVEGSALVAGLGPTGQGAAPLHAAGAAQVLDRRYALGVWGMGSFADGLGLLRQRLPQSPQLTLGLWAFLHLAEVGLAAGVDDSGLHVMMRLRTTWSNPDEVVAALEPLFARAAKGEDVAAELAALAKAHPDAPLAHDLAAGVGGLMPPFALLGMTAAVAIPAFMEYTARARALAPPDERVAPEEQVAPEMPVAPGPRE